MELPGKVALITGATGFVGSRTARRLVQEGMHVRGLVRRPVDLPDLESYLGDITDAATMAPAAAGAHVVVHCGAVLRRATREEAMWVNAEGTRIVLEAALQAGCERFIHLSTVSVHAVDGHDVVGEATPLRQAGDAYGESKALAEQAVWAAAAKGLQVTVLRPPAILGVAPTAARSENRRSYTKSATPQPTLWRRLFSSFILMPRSPLGHQPMMVFITTVR